MSKFKIPIFLIMLDGLGAILLVLGILGALDTDIGLPALNSIWPFMIALGFGLMVPMIVWILRLALKQQK